MKLIELHILQSFPVTCLNRDDVGAPKTAYFGGVQRARVSSQCWKRAIRLHAQELQKENDLHLFEGIRTRKAEIDLSALLIGKGMEEQEAKRIAGQVCEGFLKKSDTDKKGTKGGKKAKKATETEPEIETPEEAEESGKTSTLLYFSPAELDKMAEAILREKGEKKPDFKEAAVRAAPEAHLKDAADIAIFGRMVANEPRLTLEGAGLFSHALSTHRTDLDIDFFTAVDDRKEKSEDMGAGMMGTLEFNSACYYRYVGLNLDLLFYQKDKDGKSTANLGCYAGEDHKKTREELLKAFLRAAIEAVPSARKNTMFGGNPPAYVLGLKRTGQPLSLVNAFENPVRAKDGFVDPSVVALKQHWEKLSSLYGLKAEKKTELPPDSLDKLIAALL